MSLFTKLTVDATFEQPITQLAALVSGTLGSAETMHAAGYEKVTRPTDRTLHIEGNIVTRAVEDVRRRIKKRLEDAGATSIVFKEQPID